MTKMGFNEVFHQQPFGHRRTLTYSNGRTITTKSNGETRFALFLDILQATGTVRAWDYESKEFWFEDIKRGTVSYKPDFVVDWWNGGRIFYEVKCGKFRQKDCTKWKRLAKKYPDTKLVLVIDRNYNKGNAARIIENGRKYLHHIWNVKDDYKKLGIKI